MTPPQPPYQKWSSYAFGLAGLCLAVLALANVFGFTSRALNSVLMTGIFVAGTAAWIVQARQICPHCGVPYGYRIRIVNANICRKCGGDLSG